MDKDNEKKISKYSSGFTVLDRAVDVIEDVL